MIEHFLKQLACITIGFGSGVVISGGVFAFIAIIGIVPRLAQKTGTEKHFMLYENAMIVGGIGGTILTYVDVYLPTPAIIVAILSSFMGVFFGCLAVSLAEVLDVIPVFTRHTRIKQGLPIFISVIAFGKLIGSVLYYFVPNFFQ